jgi:tetratricopeptide (TPR) repeat protein
MVIRIKPYLPEPYFYRGAAKLDLEDYLGAKSDLNKAIEIKPFYPEAIMYRGIVNYHLKEYNSAMQDYSKAMELDGENADIFNNRGICKAAMRNFEGAIEDYTKSIELKAKNFNAYLNRSIAYQVQKEWDNAIADCNQLIRIKPNSPMGYMSRGLIKIEKEEYAGALRDFDMAIYLDPQNAFAYQNRGMVKQQLESYQAAIMDYNSAIQIDNQMASAYFNRGIAKEMTGSDGYQKDYDYASMLDPRYEKRPWQTPQEKATAQQQQMKAWQQATPNDTNKKEESDSIQSTKNKMGIDLDELRKRKMKANLVAEDNRDIPGKEDEESEKVQNQNINIQLLPLFEVATINKNSADNEIVGYFSMLIENLNSANNYQPYLTLINQPIATLQAKEIYENQILIFDERIKQNNQFSNNYLYRGIFKALIEDYDGAIDDFGSSIKYDERNLLAYFMRANTRAKMIEAIESISSPNKISSINQPPQFSGNKKELKEINEALEEIMTDYSVVLYMNPDFSFGYFNRGNIYCHNERYFDALNQYTQALKVEPEFAEAYYNRGLIKILLNDIKGGSNDLSKAGELGIKESYNVIKRYCNQ